MSFIKVHNADCAGNPVMVNLDHVTEITQTVIHDSGSPATIYFGTEMDCLRINTSESFAQMEEIVLRRPE